MAKVKGRRRRSNEPFYSHVVTPCSTSATGSRRISSKLMTPAKPKHADYIHDGYTFAKRVLQGYWSGKSTNIEMLAKLMSNSPQVCRDHYLQ